MVSISCCFLGVVLSPRERHSYIFWIQVCAGAQRAVLDIGTRNCMRASLGLGLSCARVSPRRAAQGTNGVNSTAWRSRYGG
eukprot:760119-Pyramimonas_sp.AAC.1